MIKAPETTGVTGQVKVTWMAGAVGTGQVAEALFVTVPPLQLSRPVAMTLPVTEHVPAEALRVKLPEAPGARVAAENRRGGEDKVLISDSLNARLYMRTSSMAPLKKLAPPPPRAPTAQLVFT